MASGETLLLWDASVGKPTVTNGAVQDERNEQDVYLFDDTTNQSLVFRDIMPRNYAGGGITVYHHYSMTTATSGDVDLDGAFERIGDGQLDTDADSFATAVSTDGTTVDGTSGNVDIISIAFTDGAQIDSIAVGESFRYKFNTDSAGTATGDFELRAIELKET